MLKDLRRELLRRRLDRLAVARPGSVEGPTPDQLTHMVTDFFTRHLASA